VLTVSFHESGRSLFPGTGSVEEMGEGSAAGTSVNVPLEPLCGPDAWLAAVRRVVPALAAAFGPDVIVSQHGADGHVWDPLAHLSLTTTAMGEAARLVDRLAHRRAGGRWFATGGGGYAIYRVVPRAWALTWLAATHREAPRLLPDDWRARWAGEAARWDDDPLPLGFEDEPGVPSERSISPASAAEAVRTVGLVRALAVPALLRVAEERGWWEAEGSSGSDAGGQVTPARAEGAATLVVPLTLEMLDRVQLATRSIAPADPREGLGLLRAALADGAFAVGAAAGEWLVGVALAAPSTVEGVDQVAALGVAPEWRRHGLATALLGGLVEQQRRGRALVALHTLAERDPFDPLAREVRRSVADRLFRAAGFVPQVAPLRIKTADPDAFAVAHFTRDATAELRSAVETWSAAL
jgi:GNAT superfamily N-acetyltransferase